MKCIFCGCGNLTTDTIWSGFEWDCPQCEASSCEISEPDGEKYRRYVNPSGKRKMMDCPEGLLMVVDEVTL